MKANSSRNSMFSLSEKSSSRTAWIAIRSASVAVMTRGTLKTGSDPALKRGLVVRGVMPGELARLESARKVVAWRSRMRRPEIGRGPAPEQAVIQRAGHFPEKWKTVFRRLQKNKNPERFPTSESSDGKNEHGAYRPHAPPLPAKRSAPNDRPRP